MSTSLHRPLLVLKQTLEAGRAEILPLTDEEIEGQKGNMTFPRSLGSSMARQQCILTRCLPAQTLNIFSALRLTSSTKHPTALSLQNWQSRTFKKESSFPVTRSNQKVSVSNPLGSFLMVPSSEELVRKTRRLFSFCFRECG